MRRLLGLLTLLPLAASAATLVLNGTAPTVPLSLRSPAGDVWSCPLSQLAIRGDFDLSGSAVVVDAGGTVTGCVQTTIAPPQALGSTSFTQNTYAASASIGRTYIGVKRNGSTASSLSVVWSANGGVYPTGGSLFWAPGDVSTKFIQLSIPPNPTVRTITLTLPGSTATLTVSK